MTFAYADPPYLRQGTRHYGAKHEQAHVWDTLDAHRDLIEQLRQQYPDGWALSASSSSLWYLLPCCPPNTRIAAWVKPFCAFKRGVRPAYAWEPVLFYGGRNPPAVSHPPPLKGGKQTTPKDFHSACITLKKGLVGAKPATFCHWVLDLLNVRPGDTVVDLFPGTGAFSIAAAQRTRERAEAED